MKKLITLLLIIITSVGYSQERWDEIVSPEEVERWKDSMRNNIATPTLEKLSEKGRYKDSVYMSKQTLDTMKFIIAIFNEVNHQRRLRGIPTLKMGSSEQIRSTIDWADEQAVGSFCGHNSNKWGDDVVTEISAVNVFVLHQYRSGRENGELYRNIAKELVNQWVESSGHYQHMVRTDFKISTVGVSFRKNSSGSVTIFASLRGHN